MARRKPISSLHSIVNCNIVNKLRSFCVLHRTNCNTCKVTGHEGLRCTIWNCYYSCTGMDETYDCPKLVKAVNEIIEWIPPYEMRIQITKYFDDGYKLIKSEDPCTAMVGFEVMAQLEKDFCRSTLRKLMMQFRVTIRKYCSHVDIYKDEERRNLSDFSFVELNKNFKNVPSKFLNIYLPFCWRLVVIDLNHVTPNNRILELIGTHCNWLREIMNFDYMGCSMDGLKKLLFTNSECTTKRNICKTLELVCLPDNGLLWWRVHSWNIKLIENINFILQNCENVFSTGNLKIYNQAVLLNCIYTTYGYVHPKITRAGFYLTTEVADVQQFLQIYPEVTYLDFQCLVLTDKALIIPNFQNLIHLSVMFCLPQDVLHILNIRGEQLQSLILGSDTMLTLRIVVNVDVDSISIKCPNLQRLDIYCKDCVFTSGRVFRNITSFTIDVLCEPIGSWKTSTVYIMSKMPELKHLKIGTLLGCGISSEWINNAILENCFQTLETLSIRSCPLVTTDDLRLWILSCPYLKKIASSDALKSLKDSLDQYEIEFEFLE